MVTRLDFPKEMNNFKNEWVAFSGDLKRVAGHGVTATEAAEMAERAGEDFPILLFVPEKWPDYILA